MSLYYLAVSAFIWSHTHTTTVAPPQPLTSSLQTTIRYCYLWDYSAPIKLVMNENIDDAWEAWLQQFQYVNYKSIHTPLHTTKQMQLALAYKTTHWSNQLIKKQNLLYKRTKKSGNFGYYKLAHNN